MHGLSPSRLTRAGVFAAVCVGVSASGHTLMSGHEVPLVGVLAGFALVLGAAWGAAGRERGPGAILGWMLWGQLALHLVFSAFDATGPATAPHHPVGVGELTYQGVALDPAAAGGYSTGMLAVHVAAALVCALWLRRGEAAAFTLARELRTLLFGALWLLGPLPAGPCPTPGQHRRAAEPPCGTGTVLRHVVVRRGPPPPRVLSA